jgi:hypothetical protein
MISNEIRKYMSQLGKKSAKKHKELGHDSEYYRQMVMKRWSKKKSSKLVE